MTNRKISEFAVTAVLAAADYLTIVSGGVNKIITWANAQTEILSDIGMTPLSNTAYVVATDAQAFIKAYATKLQAAGAPVFVCDGTTDETQLFAAADIVNAAGGGTVQLSDGTFSIDHEMEFGSGYSNIWFKGTGMRATKFVVSASWNGGFPNDEHVFDFKQADNMTVSDFEIDATNQDLGSTWQSCVNGELVTGLRVSRLYCHDGGYYGINLNECNDSTVEFCEVDNCYDDGIHPGSDNMAYGYGIKILFNKVTRCNDGIKARSNSIMYTREAILIMGNTCERNGTRSGYGYGIIVANHGAVVTNNHCNFNMRSGIQCSHLFDSNVNNNECTNNNRDPNNRTGYGYTWGRGVDLTYCEDVNVGYNMCKDNQATTTDDLTGNVTAGNYVVPVTDGTKFFPKQHVLLHDDSSEEYNWVSSVSGNNVTLELAFANNYTTADNAYLQGVATQLDGVAADNNCDYITIIGNNGRGCTNSSVSPGTGANNINEHNQ